MKNLKQFRNTKYYLSEDGEVFNENGVMKTQLNKKNGYRYIGLIIDNQKKNMKVSRLVAECFLSNFKNLPCVNHINGIKNDDRVDNLEWVTHSENTRHAYSTGLHKGTRGSINGNSKLTDFDIKWIRENYIKSDKEYGILAISKKLNRGYKTIQRVVNNESWKYE